MYQEEYKRWLNADLEDADLNRNYPGSKEMMMRSKNVSQWH